MNKVIFIVALLFLYINSFSQNLHLYGEAKPGYIMIGKADNIAQVLLDDKILTVDETGTFLFGFGRDETGGHILKVKYKDGKSEIKKLTLSPREYEVHKIYSKKKQFSAPPKSELARIEKERTIMRQARRRVGKIDTAYYSSGFQRPVKGGRIVGVYGSRRILNDVPKNIHNGLDISVPSGTPVHAAASGKVIIAEHNFYYNGTFVFIDHGQGLSTVYLHFSKLNVKTGDIVKKGQKIGEVGTTGRSTGPHLHWGVKWYNKKIDPVSLLDISFK